MPRKWKDEHVYILSNELLPFPPYSLDLAPSDDDQAVRDLVPTKKSLLIQTFIQRTYTNPIKLEKC